MATKTTPKPIGTTQELNLNDVTLYHLNPRKGNVEAVKNSIRINGQFRPPVVNLGTHTGRKLEVLAGNHFVTAARELAAAGEFPYQFDAYVVDVDNEAAARIVLADNRTADLGTYDDAILTELITSLPDNEGTGYTDDDVAALLDTTGEDETYTRDINIPLYEPQGNTPPSIGMMMDDTHTQELIDHINAADIPEDVAEFLRAAAARHTVLDFHRIADFYAHADPVVQQLMEEQALVIIDVDDAIRGGYARLQDEISMQRLADEGADL